MKCQSAVVHEHEYGLWLYLDDLKCKDHPAPTPLIVCTARARELAAHTLPGSKDIYLRPLTADIPTETARKYRRIAAER